MKREESQDKEMSNIPVTESCQRADDLVAYLYGEANESETLNFQDHLTGCTSCGAELTAFSDVRGGIVTWRDHALNPIPNSAPVAIMQPTFAHTTTKRSALNALREFFNLSPLWLRGATAFASVLFVTLLIVTAFRFFERSDAPVVQQTPSATPAVAEKANAVPNPQVALQPTPANPNIETSSKPSNSQRSGFKGAPLLKSNRRTTAPDLSNEERSELSDLLIAARDDEESVPRLDDLLSEAN